MDPNEAAIYERAGFTRLNPSTNGNGQPIATNPAPVQATPTIPIQNNNSSAPQGTPAATPVNNAGGGNGQAATAAAPTQTAAAETNNGQATQAAPASQTPAETTQTQTSTPASTPAFDEAKYVSELFGEGVKSKEEAKKFVATHKSLADKVKKLEDDLSKRPTFANEILKGMNDAVAKGISIENFQKAQSIGDVTKLTDVDALVLQRQVQYNLSREEATKLVNRKYNFGEAFDESSEDVQVARLEAKIDAQGARKSLSELQVSLQVPPAQVKAEKRNVEWGGKFAEVSGTSKELKFDITGDDENKTPLDSVNFAVSDEMSGPAMEYVKKVIQDADLEPTDENIAWAQEEYQREVVWQNRNAIIAKAYKNAMNKEREAWVLKTQHSTAAEKQETVVTGGAKDWQQEYVEKQFEKQGRRWTPQQERVPSN